MDFVKSHLALIWKKSEPKVFNWSEFHFFEVTSYKIHTLEFLGGIFLKEFLGKHFLEDVLEGFFREDLLGGIT